MKYIAGNPQIDTHSESGSYRMYPTPPDSRTTMENSENVGRILYAPGQDPVEALFLEASDLSEFLRDDGSEMIGTKWPTSGWNPVRQVMFDWMGGTSHPKLTGANFQQRDLNIGLIQATEYMFSMFARYRKKIPDILDWDPRLSTIMDRRLHGGKFKMVNPYLFFETAFEGPRRRFPVSGEESVSVRKDWEDIASGVLGERGLSDDEVAKEVKNFIDALSALNAGVRDHVKTIIQTIEGVEQMYPGDLDTMQRSFKEKVVRPAAAAFVRLISYRKVAGRQFSVPGPGLTTRFSIKMMQWAVEDQLFMVTKCLSDATYKLVALWHDFELSKMPKLGILEKRIPPLAFAASALAHTFFPSFLKKENPIGDLFGAYDTDKLTPEKAKFLEDTRAEFGKCLDIAMAFGDWMHKAFGLNEKVKQRKRESSVRKFAKKVTEPMPDSPRDAVPPTTKPSTDTFDLL